MKMMKGLFAATFLLILSAGPVLAQKSMEVVQPADVYIRSAKIALQSDDYKRAERNLDMCLQHYPDNYEAHFLKASIWGDKDQIDSMVSEFVVWQNLAPEKVVSKRQKSVREIYESKWIDRFSRSVTLFSQADSMSQVSDTISNSAEADSLRDVVEQVRTMASEALRQCIILLPDDFRAYSTRGLIHDRRGHIDSALADLMVAESLFHRKEFEDSTTDWYDTTVFFSGPEGEETETYKAFEKKYKKLSEEKRMRYRNLMSALGGSYYDNEQWANCIAVYRRYHAMDEKNINTIVTIADCFSRLENEDEAFKWYELIVRQDPNSKDTWYNIGIFFYNTAVRLQDSLAKNDRMRTDDPKDPVAKAGYNEFWFKAFENFARAVPRLKRVVELDQKDKDTWRLLAVSYFSLASMLTELDSDLDLRKDMMDLVVELLSSEVGVEAKQPVMWTQTNETLTTATEYFPDDQGLCRMMKITLARLNLVDELKQWGPRCP